ncbi:hypothetical protein Gpo141_00014790, partial [Globisporangium polare]
MVTIRTPEDPDADDMGIKTLFGAQDVLRQPTALVSKNTLATDNNVDITRSDSIFTQDDRMALVDAMENLIRNRNTNDNDNDSDDSDLMTAILAVVCAKASDDKMVSQVRAVLDCRKHDAKTLRQCVVALVNAAKDTGTSDEAIAPAEDNQDVYYGEKTVVVNPPGPGVYGKKTVVVGGGGRQHHPEDTMASEDDEHVLVLMPTYRVAFRYPFGGGVPLWLAVPAELLAR